LQKLSWEELQKDTIQMTTMPLELQLKSSLKTFNSEEPHPKNAKIR